LASREENGGRYFVRQKSRLARGPIASRIGPARGLGHGRKIPRSDHGPTAHPAPTAREIEWKRATFKAGDHEYTDVKPERIELAIAADVEFLKTHPTRKRGGITPDALEKRRTWKAAFRARVTLFAEQNGIAKTEIAWLGRLKHQDIVAFADRHRLSYDWLLEGGSGPQLRV